MSRKFEYTVLDVFAERPLEGNPLAVFHDARGLSTEEMQALARETNLAETTFVLPANDAEQERGSGVRVRIFTTQEELPFAGHPTLGTATWVHLNHPALRGAGRVKLQLNCGPIEVEFEDRSAGSAGVRGRMRQNDPVFGAKYSRAEVAQAIGLDEEDLIPELLPQAVSTGLPFCIVPLRSVAVAQRLSIAQREASAWLKGKDAKFFYCIAPVENATAGAPQWHARMQFYSGEDPATGSAAGCCISWLVRNGLAAPGTPVLIEQGIAIKRPSRITAQADVDGERVHSVLVAGRTIPVASGAFFLP